MHSRTQLFTAASPLVTLPARPASRRMITSAPTDLGPLSARHPVVLVRLRTGLREARRVRRHVPARKVTSSGCRTCPRMRAISRPLLSVRLPRPSPSRRRPGRFPTGTTRCRCSAPGPEVRARRRCTTSSVGTRARAGTIRSAADVRRPPTGGHAAQVRSGKTRRGRIGASLCGTEARRGRDVPSPNAWTLRGRIGRGRSVGIPRGWTRLVRTVEILHGWIRHVRTAEILKGWTRHAPNVATAGVVTPRPGGDVGLSGI
jgi:hypothetical protein